MTDYETKELEDRYAVKKLFPGRRYDFTKYNFEFFDAYSTGRCETIEEIKGYNDPEHPRTHDKFKDERTYMIDFMKCLLTTQKAMNMPCERGVCNKGDKRGRKPKTHRQPLLVGIFWDMVCVWDLDKTNWEGTAEWRYVNEKGVVYGEKEWQLMAFLPLDGDEGPIYKKPIEDPVAFWNEVAEEIKKDNPDYTPSWIKNNK